MASDGLWDEISRKQSAELIKGNDKDMKTLVSK
jgi:serine/threonine protein phosphatase PrpC